MTMRKGCTLVAVYCIMVAAMVIGKVEVSEAVTCNVMELGPCAGVFMFGQKPSADCCKKVKEQRPCLCGYMNDPNYEQYVNSSNAKKVFSSCGEKTPTC